MVVKTTVFVVGDEQQAFFPNRRIAEGLINRLDQRLPFPDVVQGMLGIAGLIVDVYVKRLVEDVAVKIVGPLPTFDEIPLRNAPSPETAGPGVEEFRPEAGDARALGETVMVDAPFFLGRLEPVAGVPFLNRST